MKLKLKKWKELKWKGELQLSFQFDVVLEEKLKGVQVEI